MGIKECDEHVLFYLLNSQRSMLLKNSQKEKEDKVDPGCFRDEPFRQNTKMQERGNRKYIGKNGQVDNFAFVTLLSGHCFFFCVQVLVYAKSEAGLPV